LTSDAVRIFFRQGEILPKKFHVHLADEYESDSIDTLQRLLHRSVSLTCGDIPKNRDYQVLVAGRPTGEFLDASSRLDTLIIPWAGVSERTATLMRDYPHVRVHNIHHNAGAAAEMALALMLAAAKKLIPAHLELRDNDWSIRYQPDASILIYGSRILILGWGSIGRRVGDVCRAMGAEVSGIRRRADRGDADSGIFPPDRLHSMLPETDILIVCLPLTPSTRGMIGDSELSLMPRGAVIVNVARGAVICEEPLYRHLSNGSIGAAGLDVWYSYPETAEQRTSTPPSAYPFGELENVVMSPHRGGAWGVNELERLRMDYLADSINACARGESPQWRVDLDEGY
jgi:phosphoglycerate dehydrogenase-like enzyme